MIVAEAHSAEDTLLIDLLTHKTMVSQDLLYTIHSKRYNLINQ